MAEYTRIKRKFACRGVQLRPPDILGEYKYSRLKNVRSYEEGTIETRGGFAQINSAALASAVHSIRRMNDDLPAAANPFIRVIGAGTQLYAGVTSFSSIDTGYSGNPLALVPYRPDQSPQSWMYVADSAKMRKVSMDATTDYPVGIAPPNTPPTAELAAPNLDALDDFEYASNGALQAVWAQGGTAAAPTRQQWRVNTTISQILYDSGTTGWACVAVAAPSGILRGSRLRINNGGGTAETVLVHDIFSATSGTITISAIIYDSGTSGACSIVLSVPVREIQVDGLIRVAGAENCRVQSVTFGPDGLTSIRTSTTSTRAAGDSISGLASFRAYFANSHAAAETVQQDSMTSAITEGTGYLTSTAIAANLSMIGGRPVQGADHILIGILISDPSLLTSGKIMFDIDVAGAGAGTAFERNFFYFEFRASDFVPAAQGTQTLLTTRQRAIQRSIIDQSTLIRTYGFNPVDQSELFRQYNVRSFDELFQNYGELLPQETIDAFYSTNSYGDSPSGVSDPMAPAEEATSGQSDPGQQQWTQFMIPFSAFEANRVGSDLTRTWKDMNSCRVQFVVTGSVDVYVSAIVAAGTYGPDVGEIGNPYLYRYRGESSTTGAMSNPSPPMRAGRMARRDRVVVSLSTIADAQADKLRIERFGGNIQGWHRIGTVLNTGSPQFNDDYSDSAIVGAPPLELDNHQPFPTVDTPRSGTCDVAGTSITRLTGDTFNTSWGRGTIININGVDYSFYNQPASTSFVQLNENAGAQLNVTWYIKEPILLAQPLPSLWGPHPLIDVLFGCGSVYQPGHLFWTRPGNADSAPPRYSQEVTSPTEPLMNGGMMPDGRSLIWSTQRHFACYPALNSLDQMTILDAGTRGLFARRALCFGEGRAWFRSIDGIYETGGATSESITNEDLYVLFPHGEKAGEAFGDYIPPDDTLPDAQRLSYASGFVYFDYIGTDGNRHRLTYSVAQQAWYPDEPAVELLMAYQEEGEGVQSLLYGGADGRVHQAGGTTDNGTAIECQVRTGSEDADDSRAEKQFGDAMLDFVSPSVSVTFTPGFDNYLRTETPLSTTNATRESQKILDLNDGDGEIARNMALNITWTGSGPKLYEWQPSFLPRVPDTVLRGTDWDDAGYMGAKFVQGCVIECDTGGVDRTVEVQYDGGTVGATLTVNANGQIQTPHAFVGFIGHQLRLVPTDSDSWRFYGVRWIWEPAPELVGRWETQPTTHDLEGYFHHDHEGQIAFIGTADLNLSLTMDDNSTQNYTIPHGNGAYVKQTVELQAQKGKSVVYVLTSPDGFRLFQRDCEMKVRQWGSDGPYQTVKPFGDLSRTNGGARI